MPDLPTYPGAEWRTDHSASSYGVPVLVDKEGNAYGDGDLIGTAKAAEILGVSPRRVQKLIDDSRLPAQSIGGRWIIRVGDLAQVAERVEGWPKGKKRGEGEVLAQRTEASCPCPRCLRCCCEWVKGLEAEGCPNRERHGVCECGG